MRYSVCCYKHAMKCTMQCNAMYDAMYGSRVTYYIGYSILRAIFQISLDMANLLEIQNPKFIDKADLRSQDRSEFA